MTSRFYLPDLERISGISRSATACAAAEAEKILDREPDNISLEELAILLKGLLSPGSESVSAIIRDRGADLRRRLFGNSVVAMAPVEISNTCASDCVFCGWRVSNRSMKRLRVPADMVLLQVEYLVSLGISYIELVCGDDIRTVRDVLPGLIQGSREIFSRYGIDGKINFCTLALTEDQYRDFREIGADAMIVWQEAYDPEIYRAHILAGPKHHGIGNDWKTRDDGDGWRFRLQSQERAMRAGLEVALGTMLGLNPDVITEFLCVVDHARYLVASYGASAGKPVIIGMPRWNPITTPETDRRPGSVPNIDRIFPDLAALYLLALPSPGTWVFPNCRVPLPIQVEAVRVGGAFTSTEVKLGPGGYLPSLMKRMDSAGEDTSDLRSRLGALLRQVDDDETVEHALDAREQFVHHYHAHGVYCDEMQKAGLEIVQGVRVPEPVNTGTVNGGR